MHKRLSRIHLPAAGDEINCDYIHQALHHTTVTTTRNSPWRPSYSLWLCGSLLNSSICLLSFTLVFSFYPAHSLSSPSLPVSIVIHLYSKAIINTDPRLPSSHHVSSPTLSCPLPSSEARLWGGSNHSVLWSKLLQHIQQGSQLPTQPYHSTTEPSSFSWPTRVYANAGEFRQS